MQKHYLLKLYEKQEQMLVFKHFSNKDALDVGLLLIEEAQNREASIAIDITINGYQVFRYGFDCTNLHNDKWLRRKINTVNTVHKSSLHVGQILEEAGECIDKDWYLKADDYAYLGGGFPVHLVGTGVIGSICVSGLPHEQDHQIIIDVLKKYLKVDF